MFDRLANVLGYTKKSLATPDAQLLALLSAAEAEAEAADEAVTPASALRVPAVSCAVRAISEAAACLDVTVKRREANGTETEVIDHPVAALLRDAANDWTDGFSLVRDLTATALIHDQGGLAWVNRVGGRPLEIIRYEPAFLTAQDDGTGSGAFRYFLNGSEMPAADIIHLRSPFGSSPLSLAKKSIHLAATLDRHAASLFRNGARPSGVLSVKERIPPAAIARIKANWFAAHGAGKSGGTAIIEGGAEYKAFTMSSVDAQFLEMRSFEILQVARAFRVPPQMLYDLTRATWSNSEQMGREFLVFTLEPWLRSLEGCLRRALFTPEEFASHRVVFDRDDLTRASLTERATSVNSLIASRVLNPNEGRDWLDLPPRDGGDEYANPNTGSNQPGAAAPQGGA